jgi:hypothetical protein
MGIATALIGSALVSGAIQSRGASKAARAQEKATQQAAEERKQALAQQAEISAPYRAGGLTSQNELMRLLGLEGDPTSAGYGSLGRQFTMADLQMDPGYQFRLQQGMKQLDRRLAAGGKFFSGSALRGGQELAQGLASQEYGAAEARAAAREAARLNVLGALYSGGAAAARGYGQDVGQTSADVANLISAGGQARASGYIGQANALANALGQAGMGYGLYKGGYFDRIGGGGGTTTPAADFVRPFVPVTPGRGYVPG